MQVFANPQCTEYADGQSNEVWVRLNQDFGFDDTIAWNGNMSEQCWVITPTTEYPEDDYGVEVWTDWVTDAATNPGGPYTSGQILKCVNINPYYTPINNPKVIFE